MDFIRTHARVAAITTAILISSGTASAQAVLEEIVVTAQKREQSLQDVPVFVSAVTADTIEAAGLDSIGDVQLLVPALNVYTSGNQARTSIRIRGAGTAAADPSLEPSVGIFIDGMYMPRSVFGLEDLVDVERIEVLMGPQGTLYGKNTNSGVISVATQGAGCEFAEARPVFTLAHRTMPLKGFELLGRNSPAGADEITRQKTLLSPLPDGLPGDGQIPRCVLSAKVSHG